MLLAMLFISIFLIVGVGSRLAIWGGLIIGSWALMISIVYFIYFIVRSVIGCLMIFCL